MARSGAATKRARKPEFQPTSQNQILNDEASELHDRIAVRAFEMFERRGKADGRALEDWLRAEQEVLGASMDADLG